MVTNPASPSINAKMSTSGDGKYKKIPKTTANSALRWRAVIMAGCMLPIGVYIVGTAGTDALDAYYVLATAVPRTAHAHPVVYGRACVVRAQCCRA